MSKQETKLVNISSEIAVLSGIIKYGIDAFVDVESILADDSFTDERNRVIFGCLKKSIQTQNNTDLSSVMSAAIQLGLGEYLEQHKSYLKEISSNHVYLENVRGHAATIRRLQFGREIQNELREIYKDLNDVSGDETISQILSIAESRLQNLSLTYMREDNTRPQKIGVGLDEHLETIFENPNTMPGLSSGFPCWDAAIGGGLRRKCVDLIMCRAKGGKSLFCDNVALNVTSRGIPVLVLDTEMSSADHWNRLLANVAKVKINKINESRLTDEEKTRLIEAKNKIKNIPYHYINVSGKPFDEILAIARRWILKEVGVSGGTNDCLIIYDYLKLMSADPIKDMAEFQALGFQMTQLHNFCVEYDVPCLSFVQMNRDGITKETEDAVSGSDRIIWLCTSASILKRKTDEEIMTDGVQAGNRKLIPVVSRHGPGLDNGYICVQVDGEYMKISELGNITEIKNASSQAGGT